MNLSFATSPASSIDSPQTANDVGLFSQTGLEKPPVASGQSAADVARDEASVRTPADVIGSQPITPRAYSCRCGRPIFFRNSQCVACNTPLGYEPDQRQLMPLEPAHSSVPPLNSQQVLQPESATVQETETVDVSSAALWRHVGAPESSPRYRRCANLTTAAACNWLVNEYDNAGGSPPLCRCCRLTRTLPDLSLPNAELWWLRIEMAKRRLVSSLIGLGLPVLSKQSEDAERGLVFDLLRSPPEGPHVITGHADGVITLDVEEADDAWREKRRASLNEPYRTLLGHFRHECGHYYWQRLVENSQWHATYREIFGDEREDYAASLKRHYDNGPPADWGQRFVSSYASSHSWEDWAETWAHYLHLVDTLDTARSFGLDGERVELHYERFTPDVLGEHDDERADQFLDVINGWMELTGVLNELSRSMGVPDFYPFVLSAPVVKKLHLVHRVIAGAASTSQAVLALAEAA